jgi:two-component system chemotaxis sensor kinase CheA
MDASRKAYREEAQELLTELEVALLALEEDPGDAELIGRVFRALHTLKGSGAMFGFDDIAAFTHEVETVFDLIRNGKIVVTKAIIDLTLAAGDQVRGMLEAADEPRASTAGASSDLVEAFKALHGRTKEQTGAAVQVSPPADAEEDREITYRMSLSFNHGIFLTGANPILLLKELHELGECRVIAHTEAIPDLDQFNPEECHTSWDVFLTTRRGINAIKDVFIFVEDECVLNIDVIGGDGAGDEETPYKLLGEILTDRGYVSRDDVEKVLGNQSRLGELLVGAGLVESSKIESALVEQDHLKAIRRKRENDDQTSSVKVPADKLDILVNLVGELVTVQARLSQTVASLDHGELLAISEEVERLTAELRDNTMSIRMLPIGTTFSKFRRLVRDLSNELGKELVMITEGAETELDKTVIERLNDPLVHLIRNCIDHGIEQPAVREACGKPRQGTVQLSAAHAGAYVLIRIGDDGAGLDADAIRAKAIQRGLIAPEAELQAKEIHALIFTPGFSTAQQITSVSGRGVGMDVVKRSIDALRGSIEVSSHKGVGTTITLKLPLTLAIIDGLLVKVGDGHFVLPLSIVEECAELTRQDVARAHGRHMTYVRGEIVPYIRLRERFRIKGDGPEVEQIVITESKSGKVGFVVDKVVGEHQTVIKNMGRMYRQVDVISGATILGDGSVALILDAAKLVEGVELQQQAMNQ